MTAVPPMMRELWNRLQVNISLAVTHSQYGLLSLLYNQQLTLTELAHRWGVSVPTMSKMVSLLVQHGWVVREECPIDRRCKLLNLTPTGIQILKDVREAMQQSLARSLDRLDDDQRAQVIAAIDLLASTLT
jgi:DNA-binding MarR family transcriptional regulator